MLPEKTDWGFDSMAAKAVAVIDYGLGNLFSVRRALEHCGAEVIVTSEAEKILAADRVILPGVGAFANGMAKLVDLGLDAVVREVAAKGMPLLGICLGMQMLLDESDEYGITPGLGLISEKVVAIPPVSPDGKPLKIPHIGWNELILASGRESWSDTPLVGLSPGKDAVYFVHSFMAMPTDPAMWVADCLYGGITIPAVIGRKNVFGCQFHPEKSGEVGLGILRNFVSL
ncbi:MAG: imidazole glycerol phosphate synthase subunit HisH [Sulfuricellaceae bacterium]